MKIIQIKRPQTRSKKPVKEKLEGHKEVNVSNLKYLYGVWIKCRNNRTGEYLSGGFITNIGETTISLRHPRIPDIQEINISQFSFFVDENNENYKALQQIQIEKDYIKDKIKYIENKMKLIDKKQNEINQFEKEKRKFENLRDKFYKLFSSGRARIL